MAEIPSPMLIGVQRVVIQCGAPSGLTESENQALCQQLVKKAATLTDLPVSLASPSDLDPTDLAGQSHRLLLRVTASATSVDRRRKTIALTVTPVRAAVAVPPSGPLESSVSFVKVQDAWIIQGPVDAFNKLLAGPRSLRRPVRSDI